MRQAPGRRQLNEDTKEAGPRPQGAGRLEPTGFASGQPRRVSLPFPPWHQNYRLTVTIWDNAEL